MECIFFIVLFFINSIIVWCPTQSFMTVEGSSNIVYLSEPVPRACQGNSKRTINLLSSGNVTVYIYLIMNSG